MLSHKDFFNKFFFNALKANNFNVEKALFQLSQGYFESGGFGNSGVHTKAKNLFGITKGGWNCAKVLKVGNKYEFCDYENWQQNFNHWVAIVSKYYPQYYNTNDIAVFSNIAYSPYTEGTRAERDNYKANLIRNYTEFKKIYEKKFAVGVKATIFGLISIVALIIIIRLK